MGHDESLSTLNLILEQQRLTNSILERIASSLGGSSDQYDSQILEAVVLLTEKPKSIIYGGKVAKKRVAQQVGCDVRKLDNSPTFMRALEKIEGPQREAKIGHVTKTGTGKNAHFQADTSTEVDWSGVIEKMDRGENVNDDIDDLIG